MKAPTLLLASLALAACATVPAASAGEAAAGLGQVVTVDGLKVRPIELLEDSRCAVSVQCVWAGRVRVLVEVSRSDGARQQRELTLGEPQNIDWGWLTLTQVVPIRQVPEPIEPAVYRFAFRLTPGP
jgi:hypothetical protein